MQLGNLTSEMTVAVTSNTLGKRVFCGDGTFNERLSIVIEEKCKLSNWQLGNAIVYLAFFYIAQF